MEGVDDLLELVFSTMQSSPVMATDTAKDQSDEEVVRSIKEEDKLKEEEPKANEVLSDVGNGSAQAEHEQDVTLSLAYHSVLFPYSPEFL